jgi:SAM-dependent methyltransferase
MPGIGGRYTPGMAGQPAEETRRWLTPFLPALREVGSPLLDLGCGEGFDAAFLLAQGFQVFGCDRRAEALGRAARRNRGASFFVCDLGRLLPLRDACAGAVLASLSLHYLPWTATLRAFDEVARVLRPGGRFLFRVNATDDSNFGAGTGEEVEPGYRRVPLAGGKVQLKRFFDEKAVRACLEGRFTVEHLAHRTNERWGPLKQAWECLARAPG